MSFRSPSRRDLLKGGAAATLIGCPSPGDSAPPPDWQPETELASADFPQGVQVGDPRSDSAICWTRFVGEGSLVFQLASWDGEAWQLLYEQDVSPGDNGVVHLLVEDLEPGSWYAYVFVGDAGRSLAGRWQSPECSGTRTLVFGATCCTKEAYAPFPALSEVVGEDLDFFLLLGDQVYTSADTVEEYRPYWERNFSAQGYLDLFSSQAVIATWDDHEVGNNWGDGRFSEDKIEAGKQAFFEFTACRPRLGDPLYRSFRFGDTLELFVLDCRSERNPDEGRYISEEQLAWLLASVVDSQAVFKLVINSVTAMDLGDLVGSVEAQDRWQGFPEQRTRLVEGLAGVDNLYFLSGDFHTAILGRLDPEGPGREIFDILVGPGGNTPNPMGDLLVPNEQFIGGLQGRNYTRFTADPDLETLLVEYIGEDGGLLGAFTLPPLESS